MPQTPALTAASNTLMLPMTSTFQVASDRWVGWKSHAR
jgi:hypothetical protein